MKTVRVYDPKTKAVTEIPAAELAPGMRYVQLEGVGAVWMPASAISASGPLQHPPFGKKERALLKHLQRDLDEVYPITLKKWQDGFRRDANPSLEMAIWARIAAFYRLCTKDGNLPLAVKKDIFNIALAVCSTAPADDEAMLASLGLRSLTREQAVEYIKLWRENPGLARAYLAENGYG
jgi:hypothetical protein